MIFNKFTVSVHYQDISYIISFQLVNYFEDSYIMTLNLSTGGIHNVTLMAV
jgi:hypothetical protein